ncbi:MAG: hypothetical protein RL660_1661 [Bacteroidota bacterium]|jgi:hypothetical protein
MTNNELKLKIAASSNAQWYSSVTETFDFSYVNTVIPLTGVSAIYEYLNQQIAGWAKHTDLPMELVESKNYFTGIRDQIVAFIINYDNNQIGNLAHYWQTVKELMQHKRKYPLPYDRPEVEFLLHIHKNKPSYFQGAFNCVVGNNFNANYKDHFLGGLLVYDFMFNSNLANVDRQNVGSEAVNNALADFQTYLNTSEALLTQHLTAANAKFDDYAKKIDNLRDQKDLDFTTWFADTQTEQWQKWYQPTIKKISELENTYSVKLKLEEPALYWKTRAQELKKQGWLALSVLIALVLLASISLGKILWAAPEQIYLSWFGNDKSASIRWAIVYITLISFIAFCIRAVTKVMFSSFHLARDCEERHTLTYFYLALLKDSKVDERDRQLIMQSLFSRAETGLLKEDSSPTMPSEAIGKIISK